MLNADSVSLFSPLMSCLCGDSVRDTETRHARIDPHAEGAGPPAPIYGVRYVLSLELTRHRGRHSPEDGSPVTTACELLNNYYVQYYYLLLTRYYLLLVTLLLHYCILASRSGSTDYALYLLRLSCKPYKKLY